MKPRTLIVPSAIKGNGSGHLVRAFALARELGDSALVYVPEAKTPLAWSAAELQLAYARELENVAFAGSFEALGERDLIVLDKRATSREELSLWEGLGPVLGLDEGGEARLSASYILDILPRLEGRKRRGEAWLGANSSSLAFLDLPKRCRADTPREFRRILLSFGGEDPAGLGLGLARKLLRSGLAKPGELTLVGGALSALGRALGGGAGLGVGGSYLKSDRQARKTGRESIENRVLEGVVLLGPVQDLKEHLHQFDLVFCSFGLTAFEAAWAGCGVVLLNPSPYHRRLSRQAGFVEIGLGRPNMRKLAACFSHPAEVMERTRAILPPSHQSLASFIASFELSGPRACPTCGGRERLALWRSPKKSYFRCRDCGMIYLQRFSSERASPYTKEYFFEEYRLQYGKTYLEDWPSLSALAESRIERIEDIAQRSLGRRQGLCMLDVGCAYGPFLAAAKARGQEPYGLDASEDAANYVREELGLPARAGDFLDPEAAQSFGAPFDCLSLWYVIEHFEDLDAALRNAAALLRPGGILAFSTPSGEGVSARFNREDFFAKSPEDHFSIWEPSRVGGILKAYGFRVELVRITGQHPERFPFLRGRGSGPAFRLLRAAAGLASRLFGLGDTFEVYAIREASVESAPAASPVAKFPRVGKKAGT